MDWLKSVGSYLGGPIIATESDDEDFPLDNSESARDARARAVAALAEASSPKASSIRKETADPSGGAASPKAVVDNLLLPAAGDGFDVDCLLPPTNDGDGLSPNLENALKDGLSWLRSTKSFIESRGKELVEAVAPELQEFAHQIKTDTEQFIAEHARLFEDDEQDGAESTSSGSSGRQHSLKLPRGPDGKRLKQEQRELPEHVAQMSSNYKSKYFKMRRNPLTYTTDPPGVDPEDPDAKPEDLDLFANILCDPYELIEWINDPVVSMMRQELVPRIIKDDLFWRRFLFRIHVMNQEEARLRQLIWNQDATTSNDDDEIDWDADQDETAKGDGAGGPNTERQQSPLVDGKMRSRPSSSPRNTSDPIIKNVDPMSLRQAASPRKQTSQHPVNESSALFDDIAAHPAAAAREAICMQPSSPRKDEPS
eukprot:Selendium_serpulae@DN6455_c1_g4_i1.p1